MAKIEATPEARERYELPKRSALALLWPNVLAKLLYLLALLVGNVSRIGVRRQRAIGFREGLLAIEAGEVGWEHIFFKEAFQSAKEFLGEEQVRKLAVKPNRSYVRQVSEFVKKYPITHYFYDPRTGSQKCVPALIESFRLLALFSRRGIVPIAYCTDISFRRWRFQAAIVTALSGVTLSVSEWEIAKLMFPHSRGVGPVIFPISEKTIKQLEPIVRKKWSGNGLDVGFFGSLYEPRASQLATIQRGLEQIGIDFKVSGRELGGPRREGWDYLNQLLAEDVVVSTSSQVFERDRDLGEVNHLVWRYTEAIACGACLVIQQAPGVEKFFMDGQHLFLWRTPEEAVTLVSSLIADPSEIRRVASTGFALLEKLSVEGFFWSEISLQLGKRKWE